MVKGRTRRKIGREVKIQGAPAEEKVWKPTRKGMRPDENHIDVGAGMRVFQSMWWDGSQLSDFVLVLQLKQRSRYTDIAKVDCCHGEVHVHHYRKNGSEERRVIRDAKTPADLRIGFDKAYDL